MSYQPYLIAPFGSSLQKDVQPWLIPDDAQEVIFDAYVHHGVIQKRSGYNFLADGGEGGAPYCESRIVQEVEGEATGRTNNGSVLADFTLANTPLRRGDVTITDGTESHTDDGEGAFPTAAAGSVDYVSGVVSGFQFNASSGAAVTATYDFYPGNPVMMIANYTTNNDVIEMLVAGTRRLNKYNATTNKLDDITTGAYTGGSHDFFTWVMYPTIEDKPRLLFTNNVDQIQSYDGTNVVRWFPVISGTDISSENFDSGDGTTGPYSSTTSNFPIAPTTVTINSPTQTVTDDGAGNLIGSGTGTVNYETGEITVTFTSAVPMGTNNITIDYTHATDYIITASKILNFKDRAILLRTTEIGGVVHPQRIRISGTGQSGDDFRTSATGAGVIDIPSPFWIRGAAINRDDVIIFTDKEHWLLKFTGNDVVPFTLEKMDGTRGNRAPFAPISYLNLTKAYSPFGFTVTDGYQVKRNDEKIPDFSFRDIDQDNFDLCFSGSVDDDQNHYLIYPTQGETASNQILVNNYDENSFSIFRIPLSCMGNFFEGFDITWNDLDVYDSWEEFAEAYETWSAIGWAKDQPITVGGGQEGEIWRMNNVEGEDNQLYIWGITEVSDDPIVADITTDWHNYQAGDFVYFAGIQGATELNGKKAQIESITDDHNFRVKFAAENPRSFTAYTSGGKVSRVIPFDIVMKNFNPFAQEGQKVRCGWIYFYVDVTGTLETDFEDNLLQAQLDIEVYTNDRFPGSPTQVTQVDIPYVTRIGDENDFASLKVWRKVFINQTARFIQFRIRNQQPGTNIRINAIQPGFKPGGRML